MRRCICPACCFDWDTRARVPRVWTGSHPSRLETCPRCRNQFTVIDAGLKMPGGEDGRRHLEEFQTYMLQAKLRGRS
jgi:hypothetical protein